MAPLFLFLLSSVAEATSMAPLTIEQMVDASDGIVRGKVTEVWTEPDPNTKMVWTHAQVEVSSVLKGDHTEVIVLEQPGGSWGTTKAIVESVARFSVGEEGYFFVEHLSERSVPVGMFQGKFNVIMDPYSQSELAIRYQVHVSRTFDHRFIPLPPEAKRLHADTLEDRIEDRLEAGWDGKHIPGTSMERLDRINRKSAGERK